MPYTRDAPYPLHPMSAKRKVLEILTRDELGALVQQHGINIGGRARAHLIDRLIERGPELPELLGGLRRRRLKELCVALGLESFGREKAALLARIASLSSDDELGEATPTPLVRGIPALSVTHPHLASQWHPTRNGDLEPSGVSARTPTVVWWICGAARPHTWQAAVSARAQSDSTCPSCAVRPKNLLKDHHPALAREFHPTRNRPLTIDDIGTGTNRRVWWRCSRNRAHEWEATVSARVQTPSCPVCTGRILTPETSLAGTFPEVAREWHPTRNGDLRPEQVRPRTIAHAWWRCSRNPAHEWRAMVWQRTKAQSRCPVCFGSALSPEVAFATTHPEVAREWHPSKNGDLRPDQMRAGSERRVWWQCARDPTHEWQAIICNRARGHSCPMCSGRVATPTTSLAARFPEVAARWHPTKNGALTPDQVMPNGKFKFWWQCAKNRKHVWEAHPSGLGKCPICVGKKVIYSSSLAGAAPAIAAEWHPTRNGDLDPASLYRYSLVRVWWQCARDPRHEWEINIAARVKRGSGCPYCGGRAAGPTSSLAALYPAVAAEWHPEKNAPLTPDEVVPGAAAVVWWRCKCGHEWRGRVRERATVGRGCQKCFLAKHRVWLAANNRARAGKPRGGPKSADGSQ